MPRIERHSTCRSHAWRAATRFCSRSTTEVKATESSSCFTVAARSRHSSIVACTRFRSPAAQARFARACQPRSDALRVLDASVGRARVDRPRDGRVQARRGRPAASWRSTGGSGVRFPSPSRAASTFPRGWRSSTSRVPPKNGRPPDTAYELGVRSRNLDLEVVWIASTLRGRQGRRLVLVPPRREGVEAAMRLLNPKDGFDILSWDDPRPGLAEIAGIAAKASSEGSILSGKGFIRRSALAATRSRGFELFVGDARARAARPDRSNSRSSRTTESPIRRFRPCCYPGLFTSPSEFAAQMTSWLPATGRSH